MNFLKNFLIACCSLIVIGVIAGTVILMILAFDADYIFSGILLIIALVAKIAGIYTFMDWMNS
jgi:hypothetical protein